MKLVTVTPDMARDFLARNMSNRKLNSTHVQRLAADMAEGRWKLNGETLKFDIDGQMVDGQHRSAAAIQANTSFVTYIIDNLGADVRLNIDLGKPRTSADHLALLDISNGYAKAATAAAVHMYKTKPATEWPKSNLSKTALLEIVVADESLYAKAYEHGHRARRNTQLHEGAVRAVCVLAHEAGFGDEWDAFIDSTITGAGLLLGDARLTLRNTNSNGQAHQRWNLQKHIAIIIKAFNWYLAKSIGIDMPPMKLLKYGKTELPMPRIGL